jgi:hypothetical protein
MRIHMSHHKHIHTHTHTHTHTPGGMQSREMPPDNSCLYHAMAYVCSEKASGGQVGAVCVCVCVCVGNKICISFYTHSLIPTHTSVSLTHTLAHTHTNTHTHTQEAYGMRRLIADIVASDPDTYDFVYLELPNDAYVNRCVCVCVCVFLLCKRFYATPYTHTDTYTTSNYSSHTTHTHSLTGCCTRRAGAVPSSCPSLLACSRRKSSASISTACGRTWYVCVMYVCVCMCYS